MTRSNVFVYGTLKLAEVQEHIIGREVEGEEATLGGFQLFGLSRWIPILVAEPNAIVEGLLLRDITPQEMVNLDVYEGVATGLYERIQVQLESGELAEVYVAPEDGDREYLELPEGTTTWEVEEES